MDFCELTKPNTHGQYLLTDLFNYLNNLTASGSYKILNDELFTNLDNRTAVTFTFALATPAGYKHTGSGFITSLSISGGVGDAPTFSVSIDGTGDLVQTAV